MTISASIACDHPTCPTSIIRATRTDAITLAKLQGWYIGLAYDWCPTHNTPQAHHTRKTDQPQ